MSKVIALEFTSLWLEDAEVDRQCVILHIFANLSLGFGEGMATKANFSANYHRNDVGVSYPEQPITALN
uniref:Uncharacterized protein n=1 Tax=Rhizophora mucronata TaxID=61149 RepID=A0A2P2R461_RHIMU